MNSKSFWGSFHCYNTSTSSDDWLPDSAESILASETEYSMPGSPSSSYTSEKALNESSILPNLKSISPTSPSDEHNACTSHDHQWLLLVVPPSPDKSEQNYEHINEIVTAMMELQVNEDQILKNLQTILCLSPQSAPQLDKYISPSLRSHLNSSSQVLIAPAEELWPDNNSRNNDPSFENWPGLVPFIRNIKETRKPSYGIR